MFACSYSTGIKEKQKYYTTRQLLIYIYIHHSVKKKEKKEYYIYIYIQQYVCLEFLNKQLIWSSE